ncbi:ABC transporter substrate-binding protein [Ruania alba]|uniref:Carbohydrate ABC transporter substrate-binding protein, CUT1 family n=1 Tax=Ruania alba TaxID=648782 RepID=A0A1H5LLR5_9MICO|nr:sugar ABC transporter substrate-binding protein [Ruania alba]SEE77985.1 carbohydrate ABC transporter substrate-binding protein, CUT1 family [Ruania alba]
MTHVKKRLSLVAAGVTAVAALAAAGCSPDSEGSTGGSDAVTDEEIQAALSEDVTLDFWSWSPQAEPMAEAFMAEYPSVTVNVENMGDPGVLYTRLQNVLQAGSGVPDVTYMEYLAMPQFVLGESISDLTRFGLDDLESEFSSSAWDQVQSETGVYGLPADSGPLVMFYREDVFAELGLEAPSTWQEYGEAAVAIHDADPSRYIAADTGDPNGTVAMIWQAGGQPFSYEGSNLTVDLADEGTLRWAQMWDGLLKDGLVDTETSMWTPEWLSALEDGSIATWVTGAWGGASLQTHVPGAAGQWRVAPVPTYADGEAASGVFGGSGLSVLSESDEQLAAAGFVEWMTTSEQAMDIWVHEAGQFPVVSSVLEDEAWLSAQSEYFGDQEVNRVFVASDEAVLPGWQYLPFEPYANTIFNDSVGGAYGGDLSIADGLVGWQEDIVQFGQSQGFTVNE